MALTVMLIGAGRSSSVATARTQAGPLTPEEIQIISAALDKTALAEERRGDRFKVRTARLSTIS